VWNDANNNGVQDAGETGIPDITVTYTSTTGGVSGTTTTGVCDAISLDCGIYRITLPPDTYTITINPTSVTQGTVATVPNSAQATEDTDSDGTPDQVGISTVSGVEVTTWEVDDIDFGFYTIPKPELVGTGTPGYWKNHPEAWPVDEIEMGGVMFSKTDAISMLGKVSKDKSVTLFSSLLAAKLNLLNGTLDCIAPVVGSAELWLKSNPIGSGVTGSSPKWVTGEPLHKEMGCL
jgi:hypothetical protein